MPRKKQIVQKQRRRKVYREGELSGEATKLKPRGFFKVFFSYRTFAIIGVLALGAGLLISAFYSGSPLANDTSVRGQDIIRTPTADADSTAEPGEEPETVRQYPAPPELTIDPAKHYVATIATEKGDIKVELLADEAPAAVNNFVFLAREGFYDGLTFFRVIDGFVAQAGDPTNSGLGGPGYTLPVEQTDVSFERGVLGMARPQDAVSENNGSQFFITIDDEPTLDGKFTAFGRVIEGLDVLESLTPRDPQLVQDQPGDAITSITIEEL